MIKSNGGRLFFVGKAKEYPEYSSRIDKYAVNSLWLVWLINAKSICEHWSVVQFLGLGFF